MSNRAAVPQPEPVRSVSPDESLSQVRELLFGQQVQEFGLALEQLEQRGAQELDKVRSQLLQRQQSFERLSSNTIDELQTQLVTQKATHTLELQNLKTESQEHLSVEVAALAENTQLQLDNLQEQLLLLSQKSQESQTQLASALEQKLVHRSQLAQSLHAIAAAIELDTAS